MGLLHQGAIFLVLVVAKKPVGLMILFLVTVKSKKATFAVIWMTADAQWRGRDMEGFCDNPYSHQNPSPHKVRG